MRIRNTNDRNIRDTGERQKTVFDLERVDVLSAADDQVFDAACYADVAVWGEGGFVAGLRSIIRFNLKGVIGR